MIEVDISNIWGDISLPDLLGLEKDVFLGHQALTERESPAGMNLPDEGEVSRILAAAGEIRECSDILVVIGGDGAARGVIGLLGNEDLQIVFAEGSLSTRSRNNLLRKLEGKNISLCVCSDAHLWGNLALRELKWLLERRYGTDEAHSRIHEDSHRLIAMAAAGVDIRELLLGAQDAKAELDLRSYENPAWLYAAARHLMEKKGRNAELLLHAEPEFAALGNWWKGLCGGEIITACALMPGEAKTVENRSHFETMLRFGAPEQRVVIGESVRDPHGLNFLAGRNLDQVEDAAWETLLEAHTDAGIPVIGIQCGDISGRTMGELIWFFRLSAALCSTLREESAPDTFETDVLRRLGKPAC